MSLSPLDIIVVGNTVRITALLLVDDTPTDANTLRLDITAPDLSVTSYNLNIDPELVRDAVGAYHFDLVVNAPGTWSWSWFSNSSLTAFDTGSFDTAESYTLKTQDDQATPADVGQVTIRVLDEDTNDVTSVVTNATGDVSVSLPDGNYTMLASKFGWQFARQVVTLTTPGTPPDVTFTGCQLVRWLTIEDLETVVSRETVDRLFQDDNSSTRDFTLLQSVMQQAEAAAESELLRGWTRDQVVQLAFHDPAVRMHAAWLALEYATERRGEFIANDGKGRFWVQHERAIAFFKSLSKSNQQSRGEKANPKLGVNPAGVNANTGGKRKPKPTNNNWVFADESDGRKHGGF